MKKLKARLYGRSVPQKVKSTFPRELPVINGYRSQVCSLE